MRQVSVASGDTAAVIDDNELSITILPADKRDCTARARNHRCAPGRFNILPGMKLVARAAKRVSAPAKSAFERSVDRPDGWSVAALPQNRLVSAQIFLEPAHLRG